MTKNLLPPVEPDPADPTPLYEQIAAALRHWIRLGALRPGDRLPTVRELAAQARVNRNTAARAIQKLESEGWVHARVGRGTCVAPAPPESDHPPRSLLQALESLCREARARGIPEHELPDLVRVHLSRRRRDAGAATVREGGADHA